MNCSRNIVGRRRLLIAALVAVCVFLVGGCGDLIPARSAGVEASRILRDLRRVEMDPDPNVPLPHFFTAPPKIIEQTVGGESEWKLFYFCQHTGCEEMRKIVDAQFASILVNAKGKSTKTVDYVVSSNPSTNQLIVRCPNLEDAEAILEFLREVDVPPTQVKISCLISEIYADKTLDWETSIEIADLLGESIWAGPAGRTFGSAIDQLVQETSMPAFPGASLRELARKKMGLKVGYLSKSHKFLAVVDMLESQGYLKILMNPTLTIMNGKTAKVMSTQKVPLSRTTLRSAQSDFFESSQEWEDVVDSLEITPHVYAHGVIGLETSILIGSKLTPEGVIQLPIITKKQITNAETRIRPGESLIIGGLRKTERRDVVRGIPILKDIPLIGVLFSGRDFEERAVETIFVLTPTISSGGVPHKEMIATIQRKRGEPTAKEIEAKAKDDTGLDPFGFKARAKERKGKLEEAEQTRIEAEAEKALARHTMRDAMDRIEKAEAEAELAKARSVRAVADAKKMKEAAEAAKAEADAKAKAADAAKAVADKAIADAAKTKTESDAKTKAAAEAMAAAEKIANDATKTKEEAEKAKAEAAAKAKEAEQSKVAADEKAKAADLAKAEADAKAKAAQQAQADADAKAVAAEKVKADSEIQAKEAQGVKALADAKTKAAEKLKAEADAKALAAEKLRAEAEQVIAEANKDKPEPKQPQSDTDSTSAKEPAPEEDKVVAKGQPENVEGDGDGNSDDAAADPPANDPNKPSANAQKSTPNETKTPAKAPDGTSAKPDAEKPKPKDGDNSTEKQPDDKTAKDDADESKSKAKKPPAKDKKTKPETEEDAEAKLIMLVLSALRL